MEIVLQISLIKHNSSNKLVMLIPNVIKYFQSILSIYTCLLLFYYFLSFKN